jgi:imidazole glycerol-phosphate synthase subunit HisF
VIPRVIPTLLLRGAGLVKTERFKAPVYLGDPINVIRIFNDKEVDELVLLDITASLEGRGPNFKLLTEVATECFMPFGYGGGVTTLGQIAQLLSLGVEKVVLNSAVAARPALVEEAAKRFGSSTIVVSIDVKRVFLRGARVMTRSGTTNTGEDPVAYARRMEALGAGELLLTSIDHEGTMGGYDVDLIHRVTHAVGIPVVAAGGAGSSADLRKAVDAGASAAAAGSIFVFQGPHRGILISFPRRDELETLFAGVSTTAQAQG